jgi:hypothetical protein
MVENKPKKSKECIHCEHLFACAGKDEGKICLQFVEREKS